MLCKFIYLFFIPFHSVPFHSIQCFINSPFYLSSRQALSIVSWLILHANSVMTVSSRYVSKKVSNLEVGFYFITCSLLHGLHEQLTSKLYTDWFVKSISIRLYHEYQPRSCWPDSCYTDAWTNFKIWLEIYLAIPAGDYKQFFTCKMFME